MIKKSIQLLKKSMVAILVLLASIFTNLNITPQVVKASDDEDVYIEQVHTFDGQVNFTNGYYYGYSTFEAFKDKYKDDYFLCTDKTTPMVNGLYSPEAFTGTVNHQFGLQPTDLTEELSEKLALIAYFGYQENFSLKRLVLTQHVIWDTIHPGHTMKYTGDLTLQDFNEHKAEVLEKIARYETLPSFNNTTVTIKAGESVVLEDTNHSLDTLRFENKDGFTFEVLDNSHVKVTASKTAESTSVAQQKNIDPSYQYPSLLYRKPGSQTLAKFGVADPIGTIINFDVIKSANVKIIKKDKETGNVLAGAVFETSTKEDFSSDVYELTTKENGEVTDTWNRGDIVIYVREKQAPTGYVTSNEIKKVQLIAGETTEVEFNNQKIKGKIQIIKKHKDWGNIDNFKETTNLIAESNAVFVIKEKATQKVVDTLTTDANGEATSNELPYGEYIVAQTKAIDSIHVDTKPFTVFINEHQKIYSYELENTNKASYLKIVKEDEQGNRIALSGVSFRLYQTATGNTPITMEENDVFITNKQGVATLPSKLPYGTYYIEEVDFPDFAGYTITKERKEVQITGEDTTLTYHFANQKQMATIEVTKVGNVIVGKTQEQQHGYSVSVPVTKQQSLPGAIFALLDENNQEIARATSNTQGVASFTVPLQKGRHLKIKEIKAPQGYALAETVQEVEITAERSHVAFVSKAMTINNEHKTLQVQFTKHFEQGKYHEEYAKLGQEEAIFGLFVKEDTNVFHKDELIATTKLDANNQGSFTVAFDGQFYIKELHTAIQYQLDNTEHEIQYQFTENPEKQEFVMLDTPITNQIKKGELELIKVDAHSKQILPNVTFTLKKYGSEEVLGTYITDETGKIKIKELEYGQYTLEETRPLPGYLSNKKPIEVTIAEAKAKLHVTYENEKEPHIKTQAWADANQVKEEAEPKEQNQMYEVSKVTDLTKANEYKLVVNVVNMCNNEVVYTASHEFVAEEDTYRYTFAYELNGFDNHCGVAHEEELYRRNKESGNWELVHEHNKDHKDPNQKVSFKRYKEITVKKVDAMDKSKVLPGAVFALYRDGNEVAKVTTGADGIAVFNRLIEGVTYEIKEVAAPKGYLLSNESKTVTLTAEDMKKEIVFEMPNTLLPIIKKRVETNDEQSSIYFISVCISLVGLFLLRRNYE